MGTCVHFSRSLPSNSWWQTMAGWQALSRPPAAEGGGRRPAFTGLATQPYSATEVDGWQHKAQPGVSKPGRSTGRAGDVPRSPYPSRVRSVDSATVHGRRLRLPQEICSVSLLRLRQPRGGLTAGQKSAEGVVG